MWPFRRKAGRHQLGAAVTAIPSAVAPAHPSASPPGAIPREPPASVPAQAPAEVAAEVAAGPRVELGFRDGSTAALAPGSAQAKALTEIASLLTQKEPR